jgi:hypothetical protein
MTRRMLVTAGIAVWATLEWPVLVPMSRPAIAEPSGATVSPTVRADIDRSVRMAVERMQARDLGGVLTYVSDRYRTANLTKPVVREQLVALFALYDALRVRVRVDDMRAVGGTVWVYTTGELSGRLTGLGQWMSVFSWEREPEVVRLEASSWRLWGHQQ